MVPSPFCPLHLLVPLMLSPSPSPVLPFHYLSSSFASFSWLSLWYLLKSSPFPGLAPGNMFPSSPIPHPDDAPSQATLYNPLPISHHLRPRADTCWLLTSSSLLPCVFARILPDIPYLWVPLHGSQVGDAVDKLVQLGICTRKTFPDGTSMYRVVNVEEAAELINPVRISALLNSLATQRGRGPCAMSDWREQMALYPASGEYVRYFWNTVTGAEQYDVPEDYFPANFNATPGMQGPSIPSPVKAPQSAGHRPRSLPPLN
mmetsp:Transcript_25921/g.72590  ORF Transcript_25921/g.72590 Transcript_25921/m.72590 type:complete len:260 (-) Transcript_25921:32-811(-)